MSGAPLAIDEAKARAIRLIILDVDGVMTDGGLYLGATRAGEPVEMKRFHVEDGLGVKFLAKAGIQVAVVSGRVSEATNLRAMEIGVHQIHQDPGAHKLPIVLRIMSELGVGWEAVAMLGRRPGRPSRPRTCGTSVHRGQRRGGGSSGVHLAEPPKRRTGGREGILRGSPTGPRSVGHPRRGVPP